MHTAVCYNQAHSRCKFKYKPAVHQSSHKYISQSTPWENDAASFLLALYAPTISQDMAMCVRLRPAL